MGLEDGTTSTKKANKPNNKKQAQPAKAMVPAVSGRKTLPRANLTSKKEDAKVAKRLEKAEEAAEHMVSAHSRNPRKEKKDGRSKALSRAAKNAPSVSRNELKQLMLSLEPTERKEVELKYQLLLADPVNGPLVGVPIGIGGVPSKSVKVRSFIANEYTVTADGGEFYIGMYQTSSDQAYDPSLGAVLGIDNPIPGDPASETHGFFGYPGFVFNRLPMYINQALSGGPTPGFYGRGIAHALIGTANSLTTAAVFSDEDPNPLSTVDPLISLQGGTIGRVVAQELKVYPTSSVLNTQGVGTMFQSMSSTSGSLNNQSYDTLYEQQGLARESRSLSSCLDGECFRAVRIPQLPRDLNFAQCDFTGIPDGGPPTWADNLESVAAGIGVAPFWCVFFATGCKQYQTFRVEIVTTYEFLNNGYSFASLNSPASIPMETLSPMAQTAVPHVIHEDLIPNQAAQHVLNAQETAHGPNHTLATVAHAATGKLGTADAHPVQEWGSAIADTVETIGEVLAFLL